jgi:hypothetical protein
MVTSRSVPQQMEQMLSARAGHDRFALRILQIGHVKVFSSTSAEWTKDYATLSRPAQGGDERLWARHGVACVGRPHHSGTLDSLVELLQRRFSKGVVEAILNWA